MTTSASKGKREGKRDREIPQTESSAVIVRPEIVDCMQRGVGKEERALHRFRLVQNLSEINTKSFVYFRVL